MKLTTKLLNKIIKEEKAKLLNESIESMSPLVAFANAWSGLGSMVSEQVTLMMNAWYEARLEDVLRGDDVNPNAIRLAADRLMPSLDMLGDNPDAVEFAEALNDAMKILDSGE